MRLAARKFDGKVYELASDWRTKRDAQKVAKHHRRTGQLARVVKEAAGWAVYVRNVPSKKRPQFIGVTTGYDGNTRIERSATKTTMKKVKSYQPMGRYKETSVDKQKKAADFRLLQVSPNVIRWKGGKTETVTARTLKKLQDAYTWATDF